jgi:hypothetical protein
MSSKMSKDESKDSEDDGEESGEDEDEEEDTGFYKSDDMLWQPGSNQRKWLKTRGKKKFIDFDDDQRILLRKYFNSLDADGGGDIGVDELEEPLIALGLVDTREQVKKIVDTVDTDLTEKIEFEEFLSIVKGDASSKQEDNLPAEE